ncbi:uncharacterized protein LOC134180295 isoform X2 [Corticium candelabrum]|uniref:uncharacterized protein LOC134180295 isoform X2 n=1 Tax=Corticium candelabrum TaxID=121492 RepID=UPI002E262E55|nr:uncharacterized protein LOC134180295 isoform X2 [Corticium candelabrum]
MIVGGRSMSDCTYNRQELVNETIAGLTSKVNRFRDAVKDTTAARRDQKCRCRKEKAREVAALGKAMESYIPVNCDRPELVISSGRNAEDMLDRAAEIGQKLYQSTQKLHQLHQTVSDLELVQQQDLFRFDTKLH